jgi:DNA-binding protein H-NS
MATTKKTRTLDEIEAEIHRLQEEAKAIRAAEIAEVVGKMKQAIVHYGLTAQDLGLAPRRASSKVKAKAPASSGKPVAAVKYRDEAGNSWSGRGKRPTWFREALAAGKTPEQLLASA